MIRGGRGLALAIVTLAVAAPHGATAQDVDYVRLKWWHPLAASVGVAVLFLADQPVHDYVQDHQSREQDDLAKSGFTIPGCFS